MKKQQSETKRSPIIDIMKCMGMICIVLGHYGFSSINAFVYTFHLPLFFCLSGYLMNTRSDLREFIGKKFRGLIWPYLAACFLIILSAVCLNFIHEIVGSISLQPASFLIKPIIYGAGNAVSVPFKINAIGAIWFLLALFWGSIMFRLLLKMPAFLCFLCILMLTILSIVSYPHIQLPWSVQAAGASLPFMYVGYLYRHKRDELHLTHNTQMGLMVVATGLWFWNIIYFNGFYLVRAYYGNGIMDFLGCFGGILWVYLLSKYIFNKYPKISRFLSYFGRFSVMLLALHLVVDMWILTKPFIDVFNRISELSLFLSCFLFCVMDLFILFGVTYLVSKSKIGCYLFGIKDGI